MMLDLETLNTVEAVVSLELTCLLLLLGRLLGGQPGLRRWTLGTGLITLGRLAFAFEQPLPAIAGSGILFLGFSLVWAAAREYCGVHRPFGWICAGVAAVIGAAAWGPLPGLVALTIGGALASLAIAHTFWVHAPLRQRTVGRFIAGFYLLHAVALAMNHVVPGRLEHLLVFARPDDAPRTIATIAAVLFHVAGVLSAVALMCQGLLLRLRDAAHSDALTGLANRRALREDGARILALCRRKRRGCAVLLADLDRFKAINDTHGHAAGDEVLRHFANLTSACVPAGTTIGRWGGEEFCMLLPGASRARARRVALRLKEAIATTPAAHGGRAIAFTVSMGIAWSDGSELDLSAMIARADDALYRAKEDGRNLVREAEPPRIRASAA